MRQERKTWIADNIYNAWQWCVIFSLFVWFVVALTVILWYMAAPLTSYLHGKSITDGDWAGLVVGCAFWAFVSTRWLVGFVSKNRTQTEK